MATPRTVTITDGKKKFEVGRLGHGLMNFTWKPTHPSQEDSFESLKTSLDAGCNFFDSGDLYGYPRPEMGIELLDAFFTAYPQYASKAFLSIKGGMNIATALADNSPENLKASIEDRVGKGLNKGGHGAKPTLYQCGRVDPKYKFEDTMGILKKYCESGHFDFIGLSEVNAEEIRKAHAIHPISVVEVEYSLTTLDIEKNGILDVCKELGLVIAAYCPLGWGLLTGAVTDPSTLPDGDLRKSLDRFQPGAFEHNMKLVEGLKKIATKKNATTAQISLAWLMRQHDLLIPIPGATKVKNVKENIGALDISLTDEEDVEIRKLAENADIKGGRYSSYFESELHG